MRPPAVAGQFYPADPEELERAVASYLGPKPPPGSPPRALIAPHAGYVYSGPIAGSAFATLAGLTSPPGRVLLMGPAHRVLFKGIALSSAEAFTTPLGPVPLDRPFLGRLLDLDGVVVLDEAHREEHAIEVQLPFLQQVLPVFRLSPLVVGDAQPALVEQVLDLFFSEPDGLAVVSSDLSHYHDYETACAMDQATADAIEHLDPDAIAPDQACGRMAIRGLLRYARRAGWRAQTLDLRNSGDTAGTRDRVVGYGAHAFH